MLQRRVSVTQGKPGLALTSCHVVGRKERQGRAEAVVASLAKSAIFYAGSEIDEELWGRLYKPLQAGLERLGEAMDQISSAAIQVLVGGAAEMEPHAEATPVFAAQYFLGLQRKGIRKGVQVGSLHGILQLQPPATKVSDSIGALASFCCCFCLEGCLVLLVWRDLNSWH